MVGWTRRNRESDEADRRRLEQHPVQVVKYVEPPAPLPTARVRREGRLRRLLSFLRALFFNK